jgi:hypothetical protein
MLPKISLLLAAMAFAASPTVALAALDTVAPEIVRKLPDGPPSAMTNRAIAEHNKELEGTHPDFIKCRKLDIIGSLAKKARVCRTNEQWAESWQKGNTNVRDTTAAFAPKFQDCRNGGGC